VPECVSEVTLQFLVTNLVPGLGCLLLVVGRHHAGVELNAHRYGVEPVVVGEGTLVSGDPGQLVEQLVAEAALADVVLRAVVVTLTSEALTTRR
jgi:hypothetical protein